MGGGGGSGGVREKTGPYNRRLQKRRDGCLVSMDKTCGYIPFWLVSVTVPSLFCTERSSDPAIELEVLATDPLRW